jgi:BlaI family penicillinase repressor
MPGPLGTLTPAQYEIMEVAWDAGEPGATVAEIWQAIGRRRSITRTTVLNLVDRLQKRGWLSRHQPNGTYRYVPTIDRETATRQLAREFVDEFFDGSASDLVLSLLGPGKCKPSEVERLRSLLDQATARRKHKGTRS